jgi:ribonuclease Z
MDTRICAGAETLANGVDMLVIESTYLQSETKEAKERGHLTATQAAELASRVGARRLVLTHFSQRHPSNGSFLAEAKGLHPDVIAARDTRRYAVPAPRP